MKIFLNPGHALHGLPDPGAVNEELNLRECDIAAQIGELTEGYLRGAGCQTMLLQSHNLYNEAPDYPSVIKTANGWGADMFVSLHCNSFFSDEVRGVETLCFWRGVGGGVLAECLQNQLARTLKEIDVIYEPKHDRGVKERQDLAVLRLTQMPAALVEMGFISSPEDCVLLVRHQDEIARAIARGCTDYWQYLARMSVGLAV